MINKDGFHRCLNLWRACFALSNVNVVYRVKYKLELEEKYAHSLIL